MLRWLQVEQHCEARAIFVTALQLDAAVELRYNLLADYEAETYACFVGARVRLQKTKHLEQFVLVLFPDARSRVNHFNNEILSDNEISHHAEKVHVIRCLVFLVAMQLNVDRHTAGTGELDCVRLQVEQHLH